MEHGYVPKMWLGESQRTETSANFTLNPDYSEQFCHVRTCASEEVQTKLILSIVV